MLLTKLSARNRPILTASILGLLALSGCGANTNTVCLAGRFGPDCAAVNVSTPQKTTEDKGKTIDGTQQQVPSTSTATATAPSTSTASSTSTVPSTSTGTGTGTDTSGPAGQYPQSGPQPGTGLTFTFVTPTTMTVSWGAATNGDASTGVLAYKLACVVTDTELLNTAAGIDAIDRPLGGVVTGWSTHTQVLVHHLLPNTTYTCNVAVRDANDVKAAYKPVTQTTMDFCL